MLQVHDEYTALLKDVDYVRAEVAGSMSEFLMGLGIAVAALVAVASLRGSASIIGGIIALWILYVMVRVFTCVTHFVFLEFVFTVGTRRVNEKLRCVYTNFHSDFGTPTHLCKTE